MKHKGLAADRLSKKADNPREVAFARQWDKENEEDTILQYLVCNKENPKLSKRDIEVAATVIQWLGSNIGMCFLEECIKREPKIKQWLKQRAMTDDERRSADDYLMAQFESEKSACEQVCEAANAYLNCDGSNGRYDALMIEEARNKLRASVKAAMTPPAIERRKREG